MEPLLGFTEESIAAYDQEFSSLSFATSSSGYKLVPWLSWVEWESVRKSLFSSSPAKVSSALSRISTWRSRGCLPVVIDVTASIIEIQQSDPFFRSDESKDVLHSEQMLAMLYCMAILRLVNCVIEKTRKRTGISIADAAEAIGIPRRLIDVRHEGSHRDLPTLAVVRDSSVMALNWLKSYYWEPQKKQLHFQTNSTVNVRRDIKSKLRELAFSIKLKQDPELGSLLVRGKGGREFKHLCSRSKFFSLMAGKVQSSQSGGPKKRINKTLKSLVSLYSTSSSEVVSVLLEFLLKALHSSSCLGLAKDSQKGEDKHTVWDDWQLVITKFSNKEPELLLGILQRILDMIGTKEASKYENEGHLPSSEGREEACEVEHLSSLFAWLVRHLLELKPHHSKGSVGKSMSNAILLELLHKCLLVSSFSNNQLMDSALHLAQLVGNSVLTHKLNTLRSLGLSSTDVTEENSLPEISKFVNKEEEFINQAAKKLGLIKFRQIRKKIISAKTADGTGNSNKWVVVKSWNPCPLGMLPRGLGSSSRVPVLDCYNDSQKDTELLKGKNNWELNPCSGKRQACDDVIQLQDFSSPKKLKETVENHELGGEDVSSQGTCGHLMIDGVWKKVEETELQDIASAIRILALLQADPFDVEAQKKIEAAIRQNGIDENWAAALEYNPEGFARVVMLYVDMEVNAVPLKAFVDSGAQSTIISKSCTERCGLLRLLDQRYKGIAHGVGQSEILGRIHVAPIKIGNIFYPCSLVLDSPTMEFLFGLDMLCKHQCIIDLKENVLSVGGGEVSVPFLQEKDIPSHFLDGERYSNEASSSGAAASLLCVKTGTTEKNASLQSGSQSAGGTRGDVIQRPDFEAKVAKLVELGFAREMVIEALKLWVKIYK